MCDKFYRMSSSQNHPGTGCGILLALVSVVIAILLIWILISGFRWLWEHPIFG
jgi:hypothetical protein